MEAALPLLMFVALLVMLMLGYPVAFTLAGTALIFGVIGHFFDLFYLSDFGFIPSRIWGIMNNFTLVAVPLFVFMGLVLEKTGIAERLLTTFARAFQSVSGNLAITIILVGALLGASTGIVGATVVTMGVLSLPPMLKANYQKELACGTIVASGTLGQIIPPSIVLVLLGDIMNVDVADLFVGALIPGGFLVICYLVYVFVRIKMKPSLAPNPQHLEAKPSLKELMSAIIPPLLLITLVLGSILGGAASPTEAAACGALGALLLALLSGKLNKETVRYAASRTSRITAMVFTILIGAQFFGVVFRGLSGDVLITDFVENIQVHQAFILMAVMLLMFLLGFFLDFLEICFIVIPIILPILIKLGYDPLWLAILIALNLQTSFLTPPFGFSLFYLKGVAPPEIRTLDIYRGVIPFVIIQVLVLGLVALFPDLVLWLPNNLFGD